MGVASMRARRGWPRRRAACRHGTNTREEPRPRARRRSAPRVGSWVCSVPAAAPSSRRVQVASNRRRPSPPRPRGRIEPGTSARTRAGARVARVARSAGEWVAERRQAGKARLEAAPSMAGRAAALGVGLAHRAPPLSRVSSRGSSSLPANECRLWCCLRRHAPHPEVASDMSIAARVHSAGPAGGRRHLGRLVAGLRAMRGPAFGSRPSCVHYQEKAAIQPKKSTLISYAQGREQ